MTTRKERKALALLEKLIGEGCGLGEAVKKCLEFVVDPGRRGECAPAARALVEIAKDQLARGKIGRVLFCEALSAS